MPFSSALIRSRDGDVTLAGHLWGVVAVGFVVMSAYGVIGVAVGALVRNQVAAVVGVIVGRNDDLPDLVIVQVLGDPHLRGVRALPRHGEDPRMHPSRAVRLSAFLAGASLAACSSGTPHGTRGVAASASPSVMSTDFAQAFPVGDRKLYMRCTGSGSPTLLIESGDGAPLGAMSEIPSAFADRQRVCAYDRANNGRASSPAATPRTAADVHADLDGLLKAAHVSPPYVMIGHSAGGFLVQSYARTHPETVVGVLAMNPVPPFDLTVRTAFPSMTEAERAAETRYYRGGEGNGEHIDYKTSGEQLAGAPFPQQVAFSMLISTIEQCDSEDDICGRTYAAYEQNMHAVTRQWADGHFTQVPAGHEIYRDDFPAVEKAITELIGRASSG